MQKSIENRVDDLQKTYCQNWDLSKEQKFRLGNIDESLRNYITFFPRQALHSHKIEFDHPIIDKHIKITCDLPNDMKDLNINLQ